MDLYSHRNSNHERSSLVRPTSRVHDQRDVISEIVERNASKNGLCPATSSATSQLWKYNQNNENERLFELISSTKKKLFLSCNRNKKMISCHKFQNYRFRNLILHNFSQDFCIVTIYLIEYKIFPVHKTKPRC